MEKKKESSLISNVVLAGFAIVPLILAIVFVVLAIKNPGMASIKFIVMAVIFGVIGIAIEIAIVSGIIFSVIENKILKNGADAKGRIVSAKLVISKANYPCEQKGKDVEYNNKPICFEGDYRITVEFSGSNGKLIRKTSFLSPFLDKYQLSYLADKEIDIKVYGNNYALTEEMLKPQLVSMPQDQEVISINNEFIKIKTGIYFKKSKDSVDVVKDSTNSYSLFVKKRSSINNPAKTGESGYTYKVKYDVKINNEKKYFVEFLNSRDFSRVQAVQKENKPLPLLIAKERADIDYDKLPIV